MHDDDFRKMGCVFLVPDERGDEKSAAGERQGSGDELGSKLSGAAMVPMLPSCSEPETCGAGAEVGDYGP